MNSTNHHEAASAKLADLLPRLAIQAAAEMLDDALEANDDFAADNALRAYREAMAMGAKP